ncbi:hypothetical protein LVO79_05100 [Roseivivax marinus]|uniref:calcium-binding protein n=1 Tax=Roseivivax marinus TaxID=1379903 RepID=UPI001F040913|nr:calcium-binding protein [Roseivivax marinus]UMA65844.1 hypothetical protein LVO79_05100 [Roseivivax marinus]
MADDYSSNAQTLGAVAIDSFTTGVLETEGDTDWFAVVLEEGATYNFGVFGEDGGGGTLTDPTVALVTSSGAELASNDDFEGQSLDAAVFGFVAPRSGTYFLVAGGFDGNTGSYSAAIELEEPAAGDDPDDDYPADRSTDGALTANQPVAARFGDVGDVDWFAMTLAAGQPYRIDVSAGTGTFTDVVLRGNGIDGLPFLIDATMPFTVPRDGTYFADVYGGAVGDYTVTLRPLNISETGDTRGSATAVANDGTAQGTVDYALDTDVFAARLGTEETFNVVVGPRGAGALSLEVRLTDGAGTVLGTGDYDAEADLWTVADVSVPRDATYYVEVTDAGSLVGARYDVEIEGFVPVVSDGTDARDDVTGSPGADTISGGAGDDILRGEGGADRLVGGPGDDGLYGGDGADTILGGPGNDDIAGAAGADVIRGGDGNDLIGGGTGDDDIDGGTGSDGIFAGRGDDTIFGGEGDDRLSGGIGVDRVEGNAGDDELGGGRQDDVVIAGDGNDTAGGGGGSDIVRLGAGDDQGFGGYGNDLVLGGAGDDLVAGGFGNDTLDGGTGNDTLRGGGGADRFEFRDLVAGETDVVEDFDARFDRLVFEGVAASQIDVAQAGADVEIEAAGQLVVVEDADAVAVSNAVFILG